MHADDDNDLIRRDAELRAFQDANNGDRMLGRVMAYGAVVLVLFVAWWLGRR